MGDATADQNVSARTRRAKKACTECRQQKARCDVSNGIPCSRCRKVSAMCIISDPFKRENKRQKLDDLKHETQTLRDRLKTMRDRSSSANPGKSYKWASDEENPGSTTPNNLEAVVTAPTTSSSTETTLARTIDGVDLSAEEVNELFQLYFAEFAPFLPILDPTKSPNAYYESSAFLFWSIIGVSCRAYGKRNLLLLDLRQRVSDLAFDSLKAAASLEGIQGLLHVVSWAFPQKHGIWNPTFALLGAVLHCALNIGLHMTSSYQEFYKFRSHLSEQDVAQRTKVWGYCVMVYQRMSICKGSSSFTLNDLCQDPRARSTLYERLDSHTNSRLRLRDSVSQALRAFSECGLQEMTMEQDQTLKHLIKTYQTQLETLRLHSESLIDELEYTSAGLTLQLFHLFRNTLADDMEAVTNLYLFACQCLEKLDKLYQLNKIGLKALPLFHHYALLNSSQVLLRLYKTPVFSICIDDTRAKAMVLLAINLAKKLSVSPDDLAGRAVSALEDVVDSKKAFRNLNGDGLPTPLRVRSRGAMSILLDGLIWWREEFGGTMGVYPIPLKPTTKTEQTPHPSAPTGYASTLPTSFATFDQPFNTSLDSFLNDQTWLGFEDFLSPSQFGGLADTSADNSYLL